MTRLFLLLTKGVPGRGIVGIGRVRYPTAGSASAHEALSS